VSRPCNTGMYCQRCDRSLRARRPVRLTRRARVEKRLSGVGLELWPEATV